nr:Chain E, Non-structural protein 4 peptide [Severe acute respiratory syndrome coronavirus 2]7LMC_F Chain F, Non-structural protein 4 peptide [Severe acute respiratory syndrome coronavirus 2]7MB4_E Chain E, THR-SER-ALA-VAL-LEU-GLN [Severe acute respiratory syndrome coronavirus 2]7MB4_F Chain F, THR-SER-ALA-VAL-LEU-GLN [Severe acute respiratory syndrome coronavirus 2]7MB4_G Chain G, THR-SER-ALA-VAL-LEU-GLN [Severe acute respiratory syndrome coronavirus 2]7MB4_H Chain H, THR-SER-ALA-VAL-LEU-GLN
TSAVLQ